MMKKILAIVFLISIIFFTFLAINHQSKLACAYKETLHPAQFYETLESNLVRCELCPNRCTLADGQIGLCKSRKNVKGKLYSLVYGNVASFHLDPIEKKPLFHFLPGSLAFSLATTGCNLQCKFCQNWQISQVFPWEIPTLKMTPEEVVKEALKSGAKTIAFTYNEPTIFYEYMLDIARFAKEKGLKTAVISSGYINPEPLKKLLPYIDAYKVDFKGFSDKFYQEMTVTGRVAPVLETMKIIKSSGVWLEIVNLIIPSVNDSEEEIKNLILWVRDNLGSDVPLHFTAFHPNFKLRNLPPTPAETLIKAREMALKMGMKYVYTGNINFPEGEATYSPKTKEKVIERRGFFVILNKLKAGVCPDGSKIPGVWK